jgi:hypothetical protein
MTSARKLAANRVNARASTGPKTVAGRARVANNAQRHGLSLSIHRDPSVAAEIDALARTIAGPDGDAEMLSLARRIAEAELELLRVRLARRRLLAAVMRDRFYMYNAGPKKHMDKFNLLCASLFGNLEQPQEWHTILFSQLKGADKFATILFDKHYRFAALERYEQRAFTRRNSAVRAFDAARGQSAPADVPEVQPDMARV